ncbi:MAG: DUF423 domain-containing protein [Rhodovarius sp.]|nr:DUF423 domain-containing protein [Rhodovarius sp.]MDW8313772.1 DUF423 domain-containing protein [Rhodovarius sp.]
MIIALAGLAGAAAVLLAAIAAHAAMGEAERRMLEQAAMLLGWHAPALLALGLWGRAAGAALLMAAGLAAFAGAVALRALAGLSLGPVAPAGGIGLIAAWLWLALAALRRG